MSLDRLDSVVIGNRCEVEGCEGLCHKDESRCYEHSPTSLIEALFTENERCKFGGVRCENRATRVNQHDVPMCETCYNEWHRIQRGNANNPFFGSGENPYYGNGPRPYVTGNQQSMGQSQPPYLTGETPSGYDGGSYHRNINWRALMAPEEELGEEDCTCNNLDHSQFNEECPLNEDPPRTTFVPRNDIEILRSALGIPPMRRDEGEETE